MMEVAAVAGEGVASFRSILDKPLTQLTEHDISQLTREDCRKYLKYKGMRRPSWNKSQAIQQVISLKALLESTEDSGAGALRRILDTRVPPVKGAVNNLLRNVAEDKHCTAADNPRDLGGCSSSSIDQMTIFYCGKVNIYERIHVEKAREIMHLAANQYKVSNDSVVQSSAFFPSPTSLWGHCEGIPLPHTFRPVEKAEDRALVLKDKGVLSLDADVEGHGCRKVSLQRYLEKKRDRARVKIRKGTEGCSSDMRMFLDFRSMAEVKGQESGNTGKQFEFPNFSRDPSPG